MKNENITRLTISGLIAALVAVTTYATIINAAINSVVGVILYNALRPALYKANIFPVKASA